MDIKLQGVRNIRDFSEYGFPGHIRSAQDTVMLDYLKTNETSEKERNIITT